MILIIRMIYSFYASTIYQIFPDPHMVRIGIVIVIGVIVISMAITMYMYTQYQTNFIIVNAGEPVVIGPVEYMIIFDGIHKGNKKLIETKPDNTFVKIKIIAKNISEKKTVISANQFYLIDEKQQKHLPVYGGFSTEDLVYEGFRSSDHWLEPNKPVIMTTQFDVSYNELNQYNIVIRPSKQQSSVDTAVICITNC
jgi:hypothetical protein